MATMIVFAGREQGSWWRHYGTDAVMAAVVQYFGNVYILEELPAYLREVKRYADLVRTTHCGRTLFNHVNSKPKWMLIIPFHWQADGRANAYAIPKRDVNADADAYAPGKVSRTIRIEIGPNAPAKFFSMR